MKEKVIFDTNTVIDDNCIIFFGYSIEFREISDKYI